MNLHPIDKNEKGSESSDDDSSGKYAIGTKDTT